MSRRTPKGATLGDLIAKTIGRRRPTPAQEQTRSVFALYRTGIDWFAVNPHIAYLDDHIMRQLYPHWARLSQQVQWNRRSEWNVIRQVAQLDAPAARQALTASETKREFLGRIRSLRREVAP